MGSLIHCLELAINLKLVSYARGRNRKPLPWRRHGICSFFMFLTWTALLTNFTFGKGESQTANHFLSFDLLMSATLFYICPLFSFADKKWVKVTTISKDKVKNLNSTSTHDLNSFLKNQRVFNTNVSSFLIQKIGC